MTKEKLKFNEEMRKHAPPEQLWTEFQGDLEFEYEHSVYWPALLELCEERRREHKERWVKAGKHYGESELYLKGGDGQSIGHGAPESVVEPAAVREKEKEEVPIVPVEENGEAKAPLQTSGTQANGNTDILTLKPETALTTEEEKS